MLFQHGSKLLIGSTAFLLGTAGFSANGNSTPAVQTPTATNRSPSARPVRPLPPQVR